MWFHRCEMWSAKEKRTMVWDQTPSSWPIKLPWALMVSTNGFAYETSLSSKVGTHATQSKHKETGPKTKTSLCSGFWGCSWDHTHQGRSVRVTRFRGEKPIWRNLWHRGADYQVTLWLYFFSTSVSFGNVKLVYVCLCVWQGFISSVQGCPTPKFTLWLHWRHTQKFIWNVVFCCFVCSSHCVSNFMILPFPNKS